jgi:trigger factor
MALMRAKHKDLGVVAEVPDNDYYRDKGWEKVSDDTPTTVEANLAAEGDAFRSRVEFDPAAHTVDEVVEHIQTADEAEAARVVEAEKSGKARKSVVEL